MESEALGFMRPIDGFHENDNVSPFSMKEVARSCAFVDRFDLRNPPSVVPTDRLASSTSAPRPEVAGVTSSTDEVLNLKLTCAAATTFVDWPAGRHMEIVFETIINGAALVEILIVRLSWKPAFTDWFVTGVNPSTP